MIDFRVMRGLVKSINKFRPIDESFKDLFKGFLFTSALIYVVKLTIIAVQIKFVVLINLSKDKGDKGTGKKIEIFQTVFGY